MASAGSTVAVSVASSPSTSSRVFLSTDIPETFIGRGSTVTSQAAVLLPSVVMTVIVADPALTAVTLPSPSTVATSVLEEDQLMDGLVALDGETVAESVSLSPSIKVTVVLLIDTLSTGTIVGSSSLHPSKEIAKIKDNVQERKFLIVIFSVIIVLSSLKMDKDSH